MSNPHSCVMHEFPIPEREYRAAAPTQWNETVSAAPRRRPAPSRIKRRRREKPFLLPLVLAGLILFLCGFLLGRAGAVGEKDFPLAGALSFTLLPEEPEVKDSGSIPVRTVPGAVLSRQDASSDQTGGKEDGWRLVLVNTENPLPESFQVPALTQLRNGHAVDSRAYPELQRMMDACRAEGLEPTICSSYRSWNKQSELFEAKTESCMSRAASREEAEEQAAFWVARPGTSEHQTGLALDIVDKSYQLLDEGQENTAVQRWLMAHCAEYGFILRYPTAKSAITGIGYEPWHYRYVGADAAKEVMRQGICLEEYMKGN